MYSNYDRKKNLSLLDQVNCCFFCFFSRIIHFLSVWDKLLPTDAIYIVDCGDWITCKCIGKNLFEVTIC